MNTEALHESYAPIMHFSRGERFYPMSVEHFVQYAALHSKRTGEPLIPRGKVRPEDLVRGRGASDTFLRSVARGPLHGRDVAAQWSQETQDLISRFARMPNIAWTDEIAGRVYDWFSDKTAGATRHFWWNKLIAVQQASGSNSSLPRFRLPDDTRASAVDHYGDAPGGVRPEAYYYRTVRQGRFLNLQYWFFYAYNDWANGFDGFNDHEGDWEGVQLFFDLDGGGRVVQPPAFICYLGHHSRMTKPWDHREVHKTGTHPHVYVAAGSHASYPEPRAYTIMSLYNLIDRATGDARTLGHDDWRQRIDLDGVPWVHTYRGSWGTRYWLSLRWLSGIARSLRLGSAVASELPLPGVSAPRSPRFDDDGNERETWGRSAVFAGIEDS